MTEKPPTTLNTTRLQQLIDELERHGSNNDIIYLKGEGKSPKDVETSPTELLDMEAYTSLRTQIKFLSVAGREEGWWRWGTIYDMVRDRGGVIGNRQKTVAEPESCPTCGRDY